MTTRPAAALLLALAIAPLTTARADDSLPTTLPAARAEEARTALPLTAFYTTAPRPGTAPGTPLHTETATDYTLPHGIRARRLLYTSQDATGRPVVTSAVLLTPDGTPPAGGWPLIAWAHGTSGVARPCAPSRMTDLYYGTEGLYDFPAAGFAVLATDYHGLGTPGLHQYMNKTAQAQDVINSVRAAHTAFPELSQDWVADGHSQGGLASWGVAEMEEAAHDPHYLGTVSVAGTINMEDFLSPAPAEGGAPFYLPMMARGLQARFPDFRPETMLTPAGMKHYREISTTGCWFVGYAALYGKTAAQITRPGWMSLPQVRTMLRENETGTRPVRGPILVIAGGADTSVPPGGIRTAARKACQNGIQLSFRQYPGQDHDPVMTHSVSDQISWIRDRFSHRPAPSDCNSL